jgi:hypothetical protein
MRVLFISGLETDEPLASNEKELGIAPQIGRTPETSMFMGLRMRTKNHPTHIER